MVRKKTRTTAVMNNTTDEFIYVSGKGTQANKAIYSGIFYWKKSRGFNGLGR